MQKCRVAAAGGTDRRLTRASDTRSELVRNDTKLGFGDNRETTATVPSPHHHPTTSPPEPTGPRYSARIALTCERQHAPGQVLHAVQELRQVIDDRMRDELGDRYDRHNASSVGTDKLTVTLTLRAATDADAIRSAGLAAGTLAEILTDNRAAVDLSAVALVVRAQEGRATPS